MLAGHTDLHKLDKWLHVGWERGRGASAPYPDKDDQWRAPGINPVKDRALAHDCEDRTVTIWRCRDLPSAAAAGFKRLCWPLSPSGL
jgi:hypothetical protein